MVYLKKSLRKDEVINENVRMRNHADLIAVAVGAVMSKKGLEALRKFKGRLNFMIRNIDEEIFGAPKQKKTVWQRRREAKG